MKTTAVQQLVLLAFCGWASGQIHGEDCNYGNDGPGLCVPRFCPAPKHYDAKLSHGPYIFATAMKSTNFTLKFGGYDLNVICPETVKLEGGIFPPGMAPPSPPLVPNFPRGCQSISPLPTLAQSFDLDFMAVWVIVVVYLFYALAMVCEEFLVPAINMVVEKTGMPEDVAGATLLAAGCNSPEVRVPTARSFGPAPQVESQNLQPAVPSCSSAFKASALLPAVLFLDNWHLRGRLHCRSRHSHRLCTLQRLLYHRRRCLCHERLSRA